MELLILLVVVCVLAVPILLIVALTGISSLKQRVSALEARLSAGDAVSRPAAEPAWAGASQG
ncbi:MAG: hypothetical protein Q4G62_11880, partial [Pseudomonadota bacterium]|nr:hypothetical protein [Pseudomonadota bacterium]